jgi:hypothetical protein
MKPALLDRDQLINLGRCNEVRRLVRTVIVVPVVVDVMMMPVRVVVVVVVVVSVAGQLEECEPQAGEDQDAAE